MPWDMDRLTLSQTAALLEDFQQLQAAAHDAAIRRSLAEGGIA